MEHQGEEIENKEVIIRELEDSIRVVLGNLDNLQPFATEHFIVFPYKSKWERVSHLKFKHGEIVLIPYPFVFTLYVEMKWFHENMSPGKPVNDSPGGLISETKTKMGTSSEDSSKKKPAMETRRNRERKTQQEWQETLVSDITDVQEQDSKLGDSLAGPILPPLEQNNPSPPEEPGASGFFGFLSSLFPFRYFFGKNNH
ncbi:membrane-anchored junction protein [Otolemur garnettii]|uniref:membrane-anchored junction protein n=1 Tax=Otolemur garnettii TaxID=30611 RepID=UPI000C7F4458|nr:membrane-anchored junction protein [Otolemur garnettii]